MSIAISNMVPITMPRFVSASSSDRTLVQDAGGGAVIAQGLGHITPNRVTPPQRGDFGDNTLDFDLLAEYLLDDVNLPPLQDFGGQSNQNCSNSAESGFGNHNTVFGGNGNDNSTAFTQNQVALLAAAKADPLADAQAQMKHSHALVAAGSEVGRELQHVQQFIVHQANANVSVNPTNGKMQTQMTTIDHGKNFKPTMGAPVATNTTPFYGANNNMILNANKRRRTGQVVHAQQQKAPITAAIPNFNLNIPNPAAVLNNINTNGALTNMTPMQQRQKQKSQAQLARRRERNRILARRTRLRKKFFFESLQKEVMDLQKENAALRNIIKTNVPDLNTAKSILETCKKAELPPIVMEELGMSTGLDQQDFCLVKSLKTSQQSFVITDPSLQDNPIVYASDDFLTLTGYSREAVLGRNCRFLQGADTDKSKVNQIREAVETGEDVSVCLLNYTADGTPFWSQLFIAALRDTQNNIVNFIGVTVKVLGPGPDDPESDKFVNLTTSNNKQINQLEGNEDNNFDIVEDETMIGASHSVAPVLVSDSTDADQPSLSDYPVDC